MINIIKDKWEDILSFTRNEFEVSDLSYNTWLAPLSPYRIAGRNLYIIASDHPKIVEIVTKKYQDLIGISILKLTELDLTPVFICEDQKDSIDEIASFDPSSVKSSKSIFNDFIRKKGLNPNFTFESFVSGKSNELAHAASLAVAENPGQDYKILFLYGGVGLGKTHLMHAIAIYALSEDPGLNVIYTTSENFTNDYIDSIRMNTPAEFRGKYRNADILLIDDIQFIANKAGTQEEFFNTFNSLFDSNKQIVISSDKPPKDINNLAERIRSRFEGGMIVDIQPPNFETRMAILRKKEEQEHYHIDDEVLKYIASNIKSNIRTLEGALRKIVLKSKLEGTQIDVDTAAIILMDLISDEKKTDKITPEKIISVVAEHYSLDEEELISAKKNKELSYPRQIVMYLCCNMTDYTQKMIGMALGGRDHATIIHGRERITEDLKTDPALRADIETLKKKLIP